MLNQQIKWYLYSYVKLVASLFATILYQGNHDRNHNLWNIVSTERYTLHMHVLLERGLHINGKFTMGKLWYPLFQA